MSGPTARLLHRDLRLPESLADIADNSMYGCFCDPPYGLRPDGRALTWDDAPGESGGFMGRKWDSAVPGVSFWREVLRVLQPGAFLLAAGGSRTFHRLACAIEDAGFRIMDTITWHHGQGFPKGKGVLKPATEFYCLSVKPGGGSRILDIEACRIGTTKNVPASPSAASRRPGYGFGPQTGEESGHNPNIGRFPSNLILSHSPGCVELGTKSVATDSHHPGRRGAGTLLEGHAGQEDLEEHSPKTEDVPDFRCVAGCPVAELDRQSGELQSGFMAAGTKREGIGWNGGLGCQVSHDTHGDRGGASRFFYCAKVASGERGSSTHPTLKPIDLCRYLARLILPPAREGEPRRLLVPFAGEASEIIGALSAGWEEVIGIESDLHHLRAGAVRIRDAAPLFYSVELEELTECHTAATPGV